MIIMRVVKQIFFVLSVSLCFRSYSGGDNPRSHQYDDPHDVQGGRQSKSSCHCADASRKDVLRMFAGRCGK